MATPSFNFKAEYAKSARSSCIRCAKTIEKDELRLAEMVQVRHSAILWNILLHTIIFYCRRQILMERCDGNSEKFYLYNTHVYVHYIDTKVVPCRVFFYLP